MGQDPAMLRTHLSSAYSRFIKNPKVDVAVKTYQANRVSVIGEVSRPGMYPLRHNGQLLTELISEAGGRNIATQTHLAPLPKASLSYPQLGGQRRPPFKARVASDEIDEPHGAT